MISWSIPAGDPQFARLLAQVERANDRLQVEVVIEASDAAQDARARKRIKINGLGRRAIDAVGQINAVLFSSQDIEVISGTPSLRRRYLDIVISQFNHRYLRALQRYGKVVEQRNHLLKLICEGRADDGQLEFWDRELVEHGTYLTEQRGSTIDDLNRLAETIHYDISSGERLHIDYLPSYKNDFAMELSALRGREIERGMSLLGPHRDDMGFLASDVDMGTFGSRGQQRTVALSLRLAEARLLQDETGEQPVMLLDDVLSELDASRRHHLLSSVASYQQVLITTTDLDHFDPDFLSRSALFHVSAGSIESA